MENKHTPTPWINEAFANQNGYDKAWIIAKDNEELIIASLGARPKSAANAAHIVRCVNAHDELVAALDECRETMIRMKSNYCAPAIEQARAVLAKLKC